MNKFRDFKSNFRSSQVFKPPCSLTTEQVAHCRRVSTPQHFPLLRALVKNKVPTSEERQRTLPTSEHFVREALS
ncbi:hypothetical protein [Scytonema sp. HK-05]|uniref:hypothetical protein n=1 Tax=Scytonema sp. HK-05 TaxID=1137095 RepID=UPI000ACF8E94